LETPLLTRRQAIAALGAGLGLCIGARSTRAQQRRGPIVRTVLEDLDPATLGTTMFHEHVGFPYDSPPRARSASPPETPMSLIVDELSAARRDGVSGIVDAGVGRRTDKQVAFLREAAQRSGVHLIVAGGYYKAPYPPRVVQMGEQELANELVADATAQRWGALGEIGTSLTMHPDERMVLRAVGEAHRRTGLAVFTHNPHEGCPACALEQVDVLEAAGVSPARLCIGHLSDFTETQDPGWATHKALAKRGVFLGLDTVGHSMNLANIPEIPEAQKVRMVLSLLEAGYEDQILLSADFYDARQLKANWGLGFSTVLVQFVPKLRFAGVSDAVIRKLMVENPRRFLAFTPAA